MNGKDSIVFLVGRKDSEVWLFSIVWEFSLGDRSGDETGEGNNSAIEDEEDEDEDEEEDLE